VRSWERLLTGLAAGDPDQPVARAWIAAQELRHVDGAGDLDTARARLEVFHRACAVDGAKPGWAGCEMGRYRVPRTWMRRVGGSPGLFAAPLCHRGVTARPLPGSSSYAPRQTGGRG